MAVNHNDNRGSSRPAGTGVLDALPAHIALLDPSGTIIEVNEPWRLFAVENHFSGNDCGLGSNYVTVCEAAQGEFSAEGPAVADGVRGVLDGTLPQFILDYPCPSPSEPRWYRMIVTPLSNGERHGAVVMHLDITERKLAEEALKESEESHRLLFEHSPVPMMVYDLESLKLLAVNDTMIEHYGYRRDEFLAMTLADLHCEEDIPALMANISQVTSGIDKAGIWRHKLRDGSVISVDITSHTLEFNGRRAEMVLCIDISERLQAESALSALQRQTNLIVDSIGEGIHVLDTSGRILFINPAAGELLGWSEFEAFGQHAHALLHHHRADGSDYPASECPITRTIRDSVTRQVDGEVFFRKDGSSFPVEYICSPIIEETGNIGGVVVSFRDITERHRMDEAMRRKDSLLHVAGKVARVGGWSIELPGREVSWSDQMFALLGFSPDDTPDVEQGLALFTPGSRERISEGLTGCMEDGTPFDLELEIHTASGRPIWIRCLGEPDYGPNGEIRRIYGATQDITGTRRLFAQVAENEERFRLVAQATVDAIWDWNLETNEVWWNSGMQALFGHRLESLPPTSRSWSDHIHPDDKEAVLDDIQRTIDDAAEGWEKRYRFRRSDGSYAQVSDRGFVIRDRHGKAVRMVGGMTDITSRLSLEEQLRQSQRLESIGQLTGGVAHDFNNLLTVILGNAETLAEQLAPHPQLKDLTGIITEAAQRGADLTRRLLAFARRQPLEPRAVHANELVVGMDNLLRRTLGEHIDIELVRGGGLWQALVDPAQLESALLNLAINARDAMPTGGRLTIETANAHLDADYVEQNIDVEPGQYVMIAVTDTGHGIDADALDRVFEPFYTTKAAGKGTGLGLSMVYGFIKQSHGHIRIYSETGQGTTVRMYLPRLTSDAEQAVTAKVESPAIGGDETILVVEDDVMVRQFACNQLQFLGYQVLMAGNAAEALSILDKQPGIDLLFTDVVMPGEMNGRQLADEARQRLPGLKVLFTSGYTENAIVHQGRLDPGVQLLSKPYRRTELARRVRQILDEDQ